MPDGEAFGEFYQATYRGLVAQLYAYVGNLAEAQEVAQEAYLRAWVYRVGYRIAVSRWRKARTMLTSWRRHGPPPPMAAADPAPSVSESVTPTPRASSPSPQSSARTSLPAADPHPLRRLPTDLLLYSDKASLPEWTRDQKPSQPWLFIPCVYGSLTGDTGRVDAESMREVQAGSAEYNSKEYVEQVVVYRDAETAERVMDGWRDTFRNQACAGDEGVRDSSRVSIGDEAIRIIHLTRGVNGEWSDEGQRGIVMRVTNVVVLYYRQDTHPGHRVTDTQFATPERDARRMATRICELTRCDN